MRTEEETREEIKRCNRNDAIDPVAYAQLRSAELLADAVKEAAESVCSGLKAMADKLHTIGMIG